MAKEILGFFCEWYDPQPMKTRRFLTKVFVEDREVEIYDSVLNKRFLGKSPLPRDVSPKDFYLGGKVLIHARLFTVVDYADPYTRRKLGPASESTTLLISPDAFYDTGKILEGLTGGTELKVAKLQSFSLNESELQDLFPVLGVGVRGMPYEQLVKFWCSGRCAAVELAGPKAYSTAAGLVPQLRGRFAANDIEAAVWHADGLGDFFFGPARRFAHTATLEDGAVTCAVVRPHAVKAGSLPPILDAVLSSRSFTVTAMKLCVLSKAEATEFLEVYDGVMPSHKDMLVEFCTGPCVALEVRFSGQQSGGGGPGGVVAAFRDFAGPWDVEMAKELRPDTIRAKHGVDRTRNAIHTTDLPEDGASECGYLFGVVQ